MSKRLVDITTLVGIESLFHEGPRDPWARTLAGRLADLYAYSDSIRYVLPVPSNELAETYPGQPGLILRLRDEDPEVLEPIRFHTDNPPVLSSEHVLSVFDTFYNWTRANRRTIENWSALHERPWVREGHVARVQREHLLPMNFLRGERDVRQCAQSANLSERQFLYGVDLVLRYPLYGEHAGPDGYYLNHPIRDAFPLPTASYEPAPTPDVCVSFAASIREMASSLTMHEYIGLLRDLRFVVRDHGLHTLRNGEVDRDTVRKIAQKVSLTPRLKALAKGSAVAGGLIGGLGAFPILGPAAAIGGAAIAVSTAIWEGRLPRSLARIRWLQWAFRWTVESEAEERS